MLKKRCPFHDRFAAVFLAATVLTACSSGRSNAEKTKSSDQERYATEAANAEKTQSIEDALREIEVKRRDSEKREEMNERQRLNSKPSAGVVRDSDSASNGSKSANDDSKNAMEKTDASPDPLSSAEPTPPPKVVANPFVPIFVTRDELGRALYSRNASKADDPIEFYLFDAAASKRLPLYLCKESSGATYPSTDSACNGAGNGQLLGYISSVNDSNYGLAAISTCSVSITGASGSLVVEYRAGNTAKVCSHGPAVTSVYILGYAKLP